MLEGISPERLDPYFTQKLDKEFPTVNPIKAECDLDPDSCWYLPNNQDWFGVKDNEFRREDVKPQLQTSPSVPLN